MASPSGFVAVWEFEIAPERATQFEKVYGANGDWSRLFRQSAGYVATELLRDLKKDGCYLTIDRWVSRDAFVQFKQQYASEYSALDKKCESLTLREVLVGEFELAS